MDISFEAVCLLVGTIGIIYLYLTWNFNYWKVRGVQSDSPKLVFGSLTDFLLMKRSMGEILTDIYREFPNEKVIGYFNFRTPALLIRDPEIVHRILVADFFSFRNNDIDVDKDIDPILGRNIFVEKDELWKKGRALMTPAFTAGKVKAIFPQMEAVAKELASYLGKQSQELNIKHLTTKYTTEIVAKCAFGIEGHCFTDVASPMHEMGKLIFEPDFLNNIKSMILLLMPNITKLLKLKIIPDKAIKFFDSILRDVIVYRQENNIQRNDLVQYLIDVKRKSIEVEKGNIQSDVITQVFTDDDILSGCVMFFIDGYETSSTILTNVLHQLAIHGDVQEKLRAEVDTVLKKGNLTFETVNEMQNLNCVLHETTRVLPSVFTLHKKCTQMYERDIGKNKPLKIEKDTSIAIPVYALHNDPKYWKDPDDFKPERFANKEDATAKSKGIYLPFGDGPRMCIGMRIATALIKLAVIHIVSKFNILPTSKTPIKISPDPVDFLISHKGGIYLKFVERKPQ